MARKRVDHHRKGSREELLPSRHALSQLVGGDPTQRSLNNYAKLTPGVVNTTNPPITSYDDDMGFDP